MPTLTAEARQAAEQQLSLILRESSRLELTQLDRGSTFLELGFDSLFLIQLSQRIKRRLGVKVAFRQLIEDIATVDGLVNYLAENGNFAASDAPAAAAQSLSEAVPTDSDCGVESVCSVATACDAEAGDNQADCVAEVSGNAAVNAVAQPEQSEQSEQSGVRLEPVGAVRPAVPAQEVRHPTLDP